MPEFSANRARNTVFQELAKDAGGVRSAGSPRSSVRASLEASRKAKKASGTAFADLVDDIPDFFGEHEIEEVHRPQAESPRSAAVHSLEMRDRLNSRVLGESGYHKKPYWWNSLLLGSLSFTLFCSWTQMGRFAPLAPGVIGISALGGLYSIRGAVKSSGRKARMLCLLGLLLALAAAAGAL